MHSNIQIYILQYNPDVIQKKKSNDLGWSMYILRGYRFYFSNEFVFLSLKIVFVANR